MEMTAVRKNQTIKEMSSQFTWTNPVMEVKIEKKILSGYAIKTTLMHGCSFYFWSRDFKSLFPKDIIAGVRLGRGSSSAGEGL